MSKEKNDWFIRQIKGKKVVTTEFPLRPSTMEDMQNMVVNIVQNREMTWREVKENLVNSFKNITEKQLSELEIFFIKSKSEGRGSQVAKDLSFQKPALFMNRYLVANPGTDFETIMNAFYATPEYAEIGEIDDLSYERLKGVYEKMKKNV